MVVTAIDPKLPLTVRRDIPAQNADLPFSRLSIPRYMVCLIQGLSEMQ